MSIEIIRVKLFRAGFSRNLRDNIYEKPLLNCIRTCCIIQQKCDWENKGYLCIFLRAEEYLYSYARVKTGEMGGGGEREDGGGGVRKKKENGMEAKVTKNDSNDSTGK